MRVDDGNLSIVLSAIQVIHIAGCSTGVLREPIMAVFPLLILLNQLLELKSILEGHPRTASILLHSVETGRTAISQSLVCHLVRVIRTTACSYLVGYTLVLLYT